MGEEPFPKKDMLGVGVIGVGVMGTNHARVYKEVGGVNLLGVSDKDEARVGAVAEMYDTKAYVDYKELLDDEPDAVSISVPTSMHKDVALDAIDSGVKGILIEKPISDTLENADKIINAAEDAEVKLVIGHIERFNPAVAKLKDLVEKNALGEVVSISAKRVGPFNDRIRDVGVITDLGVHDIDVISYLYGKRVENVVTIAGNGVRPFEDHASILMRFGGNCSGLIETNWLTPHKVRTLAVMGVNGVAYLDYIGQTLEVHFNGGRIEEIEVDKDEPLKRELKHFIHVVSNGVYSPSSGLNGRYVLSVAMAAQESYKNSSMVSIIEKDPRFYPIA
ncbi:MAG: Gfo/Idh/MocA family oxidoreductase [Halobacteriota archaeon]|nr:Gfo/Idh/MocA family oxidoreductase [Halobacteriota archaeon]